MPLKSYRKTLNFGHP